MDYIWNFVVQQVIAPIDGAYQILDLPDPDEWLLPTIRWGRHEHALTPAFWAARAWMEGDVADGGYRLGGSLAEEVAVCLLGGHGLPAEIGLAAFERVKDAMRETSDEILSKVELERLLFEPLTVRGRSVRYRFARQRAGYLAGALMGLQRIDEDQLGDVDLRDALCTLPGIGPKTASWIVRNRRASDRVAILDVHIVRACRIMGVFPDNADPSRKYFDLERRFLEFCTAARIKASKLDAVMWGTMRNLKPSFLSFLIDVKPEIDDPGVRTTPRAPNVGQQRIA